MQGETQAHLLSADDGCCYVVKFLNNPQGRRTLVNDLIGSLLLRALGVSTPEIVMMHLDEQILQHNPEIYFRTAENGKTPKQGSLRRSLVVSSAILGQGRCEQPS